jgi:predicted membrane channel-forming protein YqfA (hemolysin III family)
MHERILAFTFCMSEKNLWDDLSDYVSHLGSHALQRIVTSCLRSFAHLSILVMIGASVVLMLLITLQQ